MLQALIFDVDGTLADTEPTHRAAFNQAFSEEGLDWDWDEVLYTALLEVSGGKERMAYYWKLTHGNGADLHASAVRDMLERLHQNKATIYAAMVHDAGVPLRPGVLALIEAAHGQGLTLAIATTTTPTNIAALLRKAIGPDWQTLFAVVEDAATAPLKKPHPQVYLQTLQRLGLAPSQCLALEDSANGLLAARAAAVATLVTPNQFTAHHNFAGALRVVPDLQGVTVDQLRAWHAPALSTQPVSLTTQAL